MKPTFQEYDAAMNDELLLPGNLSEWLALDAAQTREILRMSDEGVALSKRVSATIDSVRPIKGVV